MLANFLLHTGDVEVTWKTLKEAKEHNEKDRKERPHNNQAKELYGSILIAESFILLNTGNLSEAEKAVLECISVFEEVHGPDSPNNSKALRSLAMLKEQQGDLKAAFDALKKAYTTVLGAYGLVHPITQRLLDDMVQLLIKMDDLKLAEELSMSAYKKVMEEGPGNGHPVTSDCALRLAQVVLRTGQLDSAEKLVMVCISIRQQILGPDSPLAGVAMITLAQVQAAKGKSPEAETILMKSIEIFRKHEGPESHHHIKICVGEIAKLRKSAGTDVQKPSSPSTSTSKSPVTSPSSAKGKSPTKKSTDTQVNDTAVNESDVMAIVKKAEGINGAIELMNLATQLFQSREFKVAEPVLEKAHGIFLKENGEEHQSTKAAAQNLMITKNNRIHQLWQDIAKEEIEVLEGIENISLGNGSSKEDFEW